MISCRIARLYGRKILNTCAFDSFKDDTKDVEVNEIAIVAIHTSPNDAVKEINALDEVRKWVTKRYELHFR